MTKDNLESEIRAATKRIENLRFEIAVEEAVLDRLQRAAKPDTDTQKPGTGQHKPAGPIAALREGSLASEMVTVLMESGDPMRARQFADALKRRGVTTTSKHGLKFMVGIALQRRDDLFERVRPGLYGLRRQERENNDQG